MQRAKMFTPHPGKVTDPRYRVAREGRVPAYRQTNTRKDQQQDFKKTLNRTRFYAKKGVSKKALFSRWLQIRFVVPLAMFSM